MSEFIGGPGSNRGRMRGINAAVEMMRTRILTGKRTEKSLMYKSTFSGGEGLESMTLGEASVLINAATIPSYCVEDLGWS